MMTSAFFWKIGFNSV